MLFAISLLLGLILIGTIWYFVDRANRKAREKRQKQAAEAAAMRRRQNRQTWDNPVLLQPVQTRPAGHTMATPAQGTRQEAPSSDSGGDGFVLSAVAGYVTNNGLVGALVGGNLTGGIIGDALNSDDDRRRSDCVSEPTPDYGDTATDPVSCPSDDGNSGGSD